MSLNSTYIAHVNEETVDNLAVFEEQNGRSNTPFSEIKTTVRNLVNDLTIKKISRKYQVKRNGVLNADDKIDTRQPPTSYVFDFGISYLWT